MKDFFLEIKKQNKVRNGWIVLWIVGALSLFLEGKNMLCGMVLILAAAADYLDKYTTIYRYEKKGFFNEEFGSASLKNIMNTQSFDVKEYFKILSRRFLPLQIISAFIVIGTAFFKIRSVSTSLLAAGIVLLVPSVLFLAEAALFKYSLTHDSKKHLILDSVVKSGFNIVKMVICASMTMMIILLALSIISSNLVMKGVSDSSIVRVAYNGDIYAGMSVIASVVLVFSLLDGRFHVLKSGKRHIFSVLAAVIMIAGVILYSFAAKEHNVMISEDKIIVRERSEERSYGLEDVESFRVYSDDDALQIELAVSDGKTVKLFATTLDDTTAWKDRYSNDYSFAAEFCGRLIERGIPGKLEEKDKLGKIADKKSEKCRESFQEIVNMLQ